MPFGAFVQVGDGIEGLVHISEMSAHHVDLPDQVVTPGEELWVKIIDLDLQRRRISLVDQAGRRGRRGRRGVPRALRRARLRRRGQLHRPGVRRHGDEEAWEQYEQSQGDATDAPAAPAEAGDAPATADEPETAAVPETDEAPVANVSS